MEFLFKASSVLSKFRLYRVTIRRLGTSPHLTTPGLTGIWCTADLYLSQNSIGDTSANKNNTLNGLITCKSFWSSGSLAGTTEVKLPDC